MMSELEIHNMGSGYTCFVNSFAVFISEEEIGISNSAVLKIFNNVNTEQEFLKLKLPIKHTTVQNGNAAPEKCSKAFEIDVSDQRRV